MIDRISYKTCLDCNEKKSIADFGPIYAKGTRRIIDRRPLCRNCEKIIHQREYRERKERERIKKTLSISWQERIERERLKWQKKGLKYDFGITLERYQSLFRAQNGVCAICKQPEKGAKKLAVDHNHRTGTVRSLLCSRCNSGIGMFNEDIDRMEQAIAYLRFHQSWEES